MRVALFALTGFGNKVLDALLAESCEVGFVLTRKEKGPFPYYAEKNLSEYAAEKSIKIYEFVDWNAVEKIIKDFAPQLLLVSTFHKIIPQKIIDSVPLVVNMHPSLLPRYRGATPMDAVLFNQEKETGVTAHYLTKELDAGDILIQKKVTIASDETKNTLMKKLATATAVAVSELVRKIQIKKVRGMPQNETVATYVPRFKSAIVIFVLGGALKKSKNGTWRTATLREKGDQFGVTGDRLRVVAASHLYKSNPNASIITVGGKGQLQRVPGVPPISRVMKEELVKLKVSPDDILEENKSGSTHMQLQEVKRIITRHAIREAIVVSNQYHLPRIKAFIEQDAELKRMMQSKQLRLQSAEDVLVQADSKKWKDMISRTYKSKSMKDRIKMEKRGADSIKRGTYKL
ncbi:MAG: formyltransferase family protein [Patescibacteria group bacterium]